MEGDDLRQRGDSDDLRSQSCVTPTSQSKLQSTCNKLKSENDKLRVELESTMEKVKEQEIKIERLTMGGKESEKKLLEMESEMVQQCKSAQQKFTKLINEVTPKMAKIDLDSNSSGDSTMDMKLIEKNVSEKMRKLVKIGEKLVIHLSHTSYTFQFSTLKTKNVTIFAKFW